MGCRGSGSESDPFTYLPVNIDRLIWNAQRQFRIKMEEPTSLDPKVCFLLVLRCFAKLYCVVLCCVVLCCVVLCCDVILSLSSI